MPHLRTVSVQIVTAAGSREEREREHGVAHMLEHMAFKGTARRDARAIAETIEAVGGDINAATSTEQTEYSARLMGADLPLALDVLSDILTGSVIDRQELEREKNVVIQEIAAVQDTPDDCVYDMFGEAAFAGQAIGRAILGTRRTVRAMRPDHLKDFMQRNYAAASTIVSAAGAVDHDQVVAEADRRLSALSGSAPPARAPAHYTGGDSRRIKRNEQANMVLGFAAPGMTDPSIYAAQLFTGLTGGGMSSRIFQEVREKRGLAYSAYSLFWPYSDIGVFGVSVGTAGDKAAEAVAVALDCLMEAAEAATDEEIARARRQVIVSQVMGLERPSSRAGQMARQLLLFDRLFDADEIIARFEAVTAAEIMAVGRRMLGSPITLSAIGPVRALPDPVHWRTRLGAAAHRV
jgi:predicted Zn-dependent peptidase